MFVAGTARHILKQEFSHSLEFVANGSDSQEVNPHVIFCRFHGEAAFLRGGEFHFSCTVDKQEAVLNIAFYFSCMEGTLEPPELNSSPIKEAVKVYPMVATLMIMLEP